MDRHVEVETPKLRYVGRGRGELADLLFGGDRDFEVVYTNSGKAALHIALAYYRSIRRIEDKNASLWAPQWIGAWVYNIAQKLCFPSIAPSSQTRGVMVYHQYGYPQKMDQILDLAREKHWFVIEDCAHAIRSYESGRRVGLIGDVGIFSFAKFFPSVMGGALVTRDQALAEYARRAVEKNNPLLSHVAFVAKWAASSGYFRWTGDDLNRLVEMTYAVYDECPAIHPLAYRLIVDALSGTSLKVRNSNSAFFQTGLASTCTLDHLPDKGITPYVMPLVAPVHSLLRIKESFERLGVFTDVYHFDVNRDMTRPDFKKCVWIPVHPGISRLREEMLLTMRRALSE